MKLTRRALCGCLLAGVPLMARSALAQPDECAVFTPGRQGQVSPDEAIARLADGNRRFLDGRSVNCDLLGQVRQTAEHQAPFAAIVGCIDSRVPPELVFDQRIGDVFCARVAGNFVNTDILGSLEYAAKVAGAKAIVVLGHANCGAIKSAIAGVELGNITAMLENIQPALAAITVPAGGMDPADKDLVAIVTEANVRHTMAAIAEGSPLLEEMARSGEIRIAGAIHDVSTGAVAWLG